MHVYRNRCWCLVLIAVLWLGAAAEATPRLRAVCDDPRGFAIRYGSGLWELDDGTIETSPTTYPGAQPVLLIERDQPRTRLVIWQQLLGELDVVDERSQRYDTKIVLDTVSQITAIHHHAQAVWMYSLFPTLGIAYISSHSHFPLGYESRSTTTYVVCHSTAEGA